MYLLKYRSRGKSVELLQELLNAFGNTLQTDGYFGRITESAVLDFQQKNALTADGIVFKETWARLLLLPPVVIKEIPLASEEIGKLTNVLVKQGDKNSSVKFLQELLNKLDFGLAVDGHFGRNTTKAVKSFQQKNGLVADGIVFTKTWNKLLAIAPTVTINEKDISESAIIDFAEDFNLEVAIVKAVQEVESSGSGFLPDYRPTILFEGHIFWRELQKREIDPTTLVQGNEDILFSRWTKAFYQGGAKEYQRLEKAKNIGKNYKIFEAALASCSWGMYQIMGFNHRAGGAHNVIEFVTKMKRSEAEHLKAFGNFIDHNRLLVPLRNKEWAKFAKGYNGAGFAQNQYDKKLEDAYLRHSATPLLG